MERKKYLLLMAGGSGTRMGASVPKQFLDLDGKAILHFTMDRLCAAIPGLKVVTVLADSHVATWRRYCAGHNVTVPQTIVRGGISRFHSVRNGLEKVPDGAVVAVHDGVRPLVRGEVLRRIFSAAETSPAVIPVIPSVDTLRVVRRRQLPDGQVVFESVPGVSPDRNMLFRVQTPQVFHSELIKAAYSRPYETSFTDDATVAESAGIPLSFVEGDPLNIKITTPDDLVFAKAVLSVWGDSVVR